MNTFKSIRFGKAHRPSFHSARRVFLGTLAALALPASAYPYDNTLPDTPENGLFVGTDASNSGTVLTYNIPIANWPDKIDFRAIGGDGGRGRATNSLSGNETGDGGGGAQTIATFFIDPIDADALRPGGELIMIVGNQGKNETREAAAAGGGGGSSAVLYRPPVDGAGWERLIVSGGGGGGAASTILDFGDDGKNAQTGTSGSGGGNSSSDGGTGGDPGQSINGAGGGGGINSAATGGEGGGIASLTGAIGGNATGGSGGFGYSGGGSGASSNNIAQGGGGGGYTGGGGGGNSERGGGSGSYYDSRAVPESSITARNGDDDPGEIAFTATKISSNGNLPGGTITLNGGPTIYLLVGEAYSEQGIDTATDLYGNPITLDSFNYLVIDNVNTSSVGTYTVTYNVTDQFGITSSVSRTVIVEIETAPTFDIAGDQTRFAGSWTYPSFATNFDANNSEQSFFNYSVTSDNNALFSVQPTCDSSGNLTFTVPNGNYGTANCTITGFDTGASNNSSSQNFVITITQNDPVAAFNLDPTVTVKGTPLSFTDTSSWANSWAWDFDNDGNIDSTEQNPTYAYTTAGTKTVKLTVTNTEGSDIVTNTLEVIGSGFVNGDFSSATLDSGSGNQDSLGTGWYAKNGDNGSVATPDWSAGQTTGTPGVLTQITNSDAATRFGQFFGIDLDGSDWSLVFDLNGSLNQVRIFAGTLATNPRGTVLRGDNITPNPNLVDGAGWTSVLYESDVNATGTVVLDINANLSNYNVLAIQFRSNINTVGSTYDNFQFLQPGVNAIDDSYATDANETISGNVLSNDLIVPAGPATVNSVDGNAGNVGTEVTLPSGALVTVESDGTFTYDPNDAFDDLDESTGATDTFSYVMAAGAFSSTGTVTLNITQTAPVADFTLDKTVPITGTVLAFTDTSFHGDTWEWDFDNDGNIDSTDQNPPHAYATAGTKTIKLTVRNSVGSDTVTKTIEVLAVGLTNGNFSSAPIANDTGDEDSLGTGWYGKNGDDGTAATPDWSAGETTGTPGILTQVSNSGSATRFGQFFGIDLDGNNWALSIDLNGSFAQVRIYAGTLADIPSGEVLRGDDISPDPDLVDGNGWTSVLYETSVSGSGSVTLDIDSDLSQFNVMAIQFMGSGAHIGTTYDKIQIVPKNYTGWSAENGYNGGFDSDDNGDGQANGLDYVFNEVNPVALTGEGILEAPASVPADVILHLQSTTDLNTWTTILTYTDGSISFQDSSINIIDGIITHTTTGSDVFYRYGASLQE